MPAPASQYTFTEAARALGASHGWVRKWVDKLTIPYIKRGSMCFLDQEGFDELREQWNKSPKRETAPTA